MIREVRNHLIEKILPFWQSLRDDANGGYYGLVDFDLHVDREAFKGCVLNSRITWLFSASARLFLDERDGLIKSPHSQDRTSPARFIPCGKEYSAKVPGGFISDENANSAECSDVGALGQNANLAKGSDIPMSQKYIEELLDYARHGYEFMKAACLDKEHGGAFWSVSFDGKPYDTTKHTYNQAFAIYALAAYYDVSGDAEALDTALELYQIIEGKCRDEGGYLESFDREFVPSSNEKLSENGVMATRTMNTLLHVFEAYTELYRVLTGIRVCEEYGAWPADGDDAAGGDAFAFLDAINGKGAALHDAAMGDAFDLHGVATRNAFALHGAAAGNAFALRDEALEIRGKIDEILRIFAEKMYNPSKHRQEVFFDLEYGTLIDLISYGHDIETAWLLDRGLDVLALADGRMADRRPGGMQVLYGKIRDISKCLTDNIYRTAFDGHSLPEECENGVVKTSRTWWMQAEAVNGFLNGYQHEPVKGEYLEAARSTWKYICDFVVDWREGSEWFHDLDEDGKPLMGYKNSPIADQWKCPYHNGRMCIEVVRRGVE